MNARKLLRVAGLVISLLAVAWIVMRFVESGALARLADLPIATGVLVSWLVAGAGAYAAAMALPALAWWRIVCGLAPHAPPAWPTMGTYAVSQYGKYLPGNVAHYALRHVWSRRYDIPHASLALASIMEAALLVLGALALIVGAGVQPTALSRLVDPRVAVVAVLLGIVTLALALYWIRRRRLFTCLHVPALPPSMTLAAFACYVAFFVCSALLVVGLARVLDFPVASAALLCAATAASWLAGFVVVGAPAGLGVREATFVALTGATLGEDHALLLIGLFRIVTFLGDTIFLAAGAAVMRNAQRHNDDRGA